MIKLSPSDKKLLALFLIVSVIIFSVFIIDFFLNANNFFDISNSIDTTNTIEKLIETINSKPQNTTQAIIRESLTEIFNLMNNKDYEKLFDLVSTDFKKTMFNDSLDTFTKFMNSYGDKNYSPYFTEYERFNDTYMVLVSFVPYSNTDEDIINTKRPQKSDTFFLHYLDGGSYTFSFLNFVGEKEMGNGVENSQFKVILNKTILYKTKSEYYFTITNNTNVPIHINNKEIFCYTGLKQRFYQKPLTIPPNTSVDFLFSVGTGLSISSALPKKIYFNNIVVNGNEYSFTIDTDFV